ncbi:UDP-glucose/GDP-mannose dehydrogenase family protein [Candidatus Pacearchaeota archaeon]|nr:UDP-glucose/GDP-mannose dehydrogenase family protein [Candidatus Pacearchaeota archaeon]
MKICVFGLWHLGSVTASCLAEKGFDVVGLDPDSNRIQELKKGIPPIFEPGLGGSIKKSLKSKKLDFTTDEKTALDKTSIIWVAFDTPVDEDDKADVDYVINQVKKLFVHMESGMIILISSQLPVGSTRQLQEDFYKQYPYKKVIFAYSPENLRLGNAIESFTQPERIVVGLRNNEGKEKLEAIFKLFCDNLEWMSVESAEMTKHGLNAFLATSVTFINELATLCEKVGADAREVEKGLKSDPRIGIKSYLKAGAAFAGGTLARDVVFLDTIGKSQSISTPLITSVNISNQGHKMWALNKLKIELGDLNGKTIAVLGLTYKPGTNTLRRSSSIELCENLARYGVIIKCHDPSLKKLPLDYEEKFNFSSSITDTLKGAEVLVVATEWPDYKSLSVNDIIENMQKPIVIDANRFLEETLGEDQRICYLAVGRPLKTQGYSKCN